MRTRKFFIVIALAVALSSCTETTEPAQPNIVLLISDDQSWPDYSFMGHEHIQTPSLDRLAAEGLTFTWGYTAAPLCRPALASMATGLYPHQHGVIGNDPEWGPDNGQLSGEERTAYRTEHNAPYIEAFKQLPTIMDILGEAGYRSLQTGKWWEGDPLANGGFDRAMTHGDPARGGRHGDEGLKIGRQGLAEIFDFIDDARSEEKPFFIWYAPFMPHTPHTPPDSLRDKYLPHAPSEAVANYWAMCEWFDITCGQLMNHIDELGLGENTLFVYVTDNGWIQDPDRPNSFAPGSKRTPYEMGIRTPMMFRWTGRIEPQMDESTAVSSVDIATTVLAACGLEPTAEMQGINVLDREALGGRDAIFAEAYAHDFSSIKKSLNYRVIVKPPWKLILADPVNSPPNPQFYPFEPDGKPQLYNLHDDPYEKKNLAEENPERILELTREIETWWKK